MRHGRVPVTGQQTGSGCSYRRGIFGRMCQDPPENHATKRKRAGKAKAKAKAKAGDEFEGQQKERACDPTMPDGRATLLIDDLVNAVTWIVSQ